MEKSKILFSLIIILIILAGIFTFFYFKNYSNENMDKKNIINDSLEGNVKDQLKECIENWECGEWNECKDNFQDRKCNDKNNCDTTKNRPEEKKDCCEWNCTEWSECLASNTSFRTCNLPNGCTLNLTKPETRVNCEFEPNCIDKEGEIDYNDQGEVTESNGALWEDTCIDEKILSEVYCGNDGKAKWITYTCKGACNDGECE